MQELDYDIRAFQNVLFHTELFRREMHLEDHSPGMKFHFAGPLLKRMSAEQIWDSITALILPNVDSYAPNRKRTQERIARTKAIYQSLEGRPIEEVLPRIREAGAQRREMRAEQVEYEKKISSAYAQSNNELARKLTDELKVKVRAMETKNRELVLVDLKDNQANPAMMMGSSMMGSSWTQLQWKPVIEYLRHDPEKRRVIWIQTNAGGGRTGSDYPYVIFGMWSDKWLGRWNWNHLPSVDIFYGTLASQTGR